MSDLPNGWAPGDLEDAEQAAQEDERTEGLFTPAEDETPDYVGWPEGWQEVEA